MDASTFLAEFGHLADAPGGIDRLRGLVLGLATCGRLSRTVAGDVSAETLLTEIATRRDELVADGIGKPEKKMPCVDTDAGPFTLPPGWVWATVAQVSCYVQRGKGPKYADVSPVPVVSQKCVQWSGFDIGRARFIDPVSLEKYGSERLLRPGDVLWNSTGTGTIGRLNVLPDLRSQYPRIVADSHVTVIRSVLMEPRFLWCWLASSARSAWKHWCRAAGCSWCPGCG